MSRATRPFSADETLWPCNSRLRVRSRRLTLLSSATSRRAGARRISRMAQLLQGRHHERVLALERSDALATAPGRGQSAELQLARHHPEAESAEGVAVGLEGMRGAPEFLRVAGRERSAQLGDHRRSFLEERIDELAHELGSGGGLEVPEGREVDGRCRGQTVSFRWAARLRASTSRSTRIGLVRE